MASRTGEDRITLVQQPVTQTYTKTYVRTTEPTLRITDFHPQFAPDELEVKLLAVPTIKTRNDADTADVHTFLFGGAPIQNGFSGASILRLRSPLFANGDSKEQDLYFAVRESGPLVWQTETLRNVDKNSFSNPQTIELGVAPVGDAVALPAAGNQFAAGPIAFIAPAARQGAFILRLTAKTLNVKQHFFERNPDVVMSAF